MPHALPVVLGLSAALLLPPGASAQSSTQRTISVAGEGSLVARNDTARVGFAVRTRARSRPAAVERSSARLRRVLGVLSAAGIPDADLRTGSVSVSRRRNRRGRPVGPFEARQSVSAVVRDVSKTGAVVGAAVRAGATPVEGPSFFLSDPQALFRRALAGAFRDARASAAQLAAEAGLTLGPAISVRDSRFVPGDPVFEDDSGAGGQGVVERRARRTPTRVGRSRVSATVFVVFEAR